MIVSDGMDGIMPHIMHIIRRNMLGWEPCCQHAQADKYIMTQTSFAGEHCGQEEKSGSSCGLVKRKNKHLLKKAIKKMKIFTS